MRAALAWFCELTRRGPGFAALARRQEDAARIAHLEQELGRAYRCVRGFHSFAGMTAPDTFRGYHALTIGAAIRFVHDGSLDGSDYFVGKPVEVLQQVLASAQPKAS